MLVGMLACCPKTARREFSAHRHRCVGAWRHASPDRIKEKRCALRQIASGDVDPYQYTGRENDGTGLYYYRARYYSPSLKRFISEDPMGLAEGLNEYAYASGNPVLYSDPLGLWTFQLGFSGTGAGFGFGGIGFTGLAFDGNGNFGFYWGGGAGAGVGLGGGVGFSGAWSNGDTICDLRGPFANISLGGGWGPDATGDGFTGEGANGNFIAGGGLTLGVGAGANSFLGITETGVAPMGNFGSRPVNDRCGCE
jgi:RHS repeat-associated protein